MKRVSESGGEFKPIEGVVSDVVNYEESAKTAEAGGEVLNLQVEWKKITNEFGEVEVSVYKHKDEPSRNAIFFLPGLTGSTDKFKAKYLSGLIQKEGADVILVHRNGAVFEKNFDAISSLQRAEIAAQNGQDHLGAQEEYGYKEWVKEFACAAVGIGGEYDDIKVIGHSFGGLVGLESLRLLKESNSPVLPKIKTFLSLSGQIGKSREGKNGQVLVDPYRNYEVEPSGQGLTESSIEWRTAFSDVLEQVKNRGGLKMKDSKVMAREFLQIMEDIYKEDDNLPVSVKIIQVMPLLEKYFGPYQGRELLKRGRAGKADFTFVNDLKAKGTPSERHSLQLSPKEMSDLLHVADKKGKSVIKVLTQKGIEEGSLKAVIGGLEENE